MTATISHPFAGAEGAVIDPDTFAENERKGIVYHITHAVSKRYLAIKEADKRPWMRAILAIAAASVATGIGYIQHIVTMSFISSITVPMWTFNLFQFSSLFGMGLMGAYALVMTWNYLKNETEDL